MQPTTICSRFWEERQSACQSLIYSFICPSANIDMWALCRSRTVSHWKVGSSKGAHCPLNNHIQSEFIAVGVQAGKEQSRGEMTGDVKLIQTGVGTGVQKAFPEKMAFKPGPEGNRGLCQEKKQGKVKSHKDKVAIQTSNNCKSRKEVFNCSDNGFTLSNAVKFKVPVVSELQFLCYFLKGQGIPGARRMVGQVLCVLNSKGGRKASPVFQFLSPSSCLRRRRLLLCLFHSTEELKLV